MGMPPISFVLFVHSVGIMAFWIFRPHRRNS